jgi:hypothetical protein
MAYGIIWYDKELALIFFIKTQKSNKIKWYWFFHLLLWLLWVYHSNIIEKIKKEKEKKNFYPRK